MKKHWLETTILASVFLLSCMAILAGKWGFTIITTHSVPDGLWQRTQAPLTHGQIVSWCPPQTRIFKLLRDRYFHGDGCPGNYAVILKPIAALPGDAVEVSEAGIRVNGKLLGNSKQMKQDGMKRPLPGYPYGSYRVAPNTVWLVSHYVPDSVDSRYFGPVPLQAIISPMKPVWVAYQP